MSRGKKLFLDFAGHWSFRTEIEHPSCSKKKKLGDHKKKREDNITCFADSLDNIKHDYKWVKHTFLDIILLIKIVRITKLL